MIQHLVWEQESIRPTKQAIANFPTYKIHTFIVLWNSKCYKLTLTHRFNLHVRVILNNHYIVIEPDPTKTITTSLLK